jgi:hypothetical protein
VTVLTVDPISPSAAASARSRGGNGAPIVGARGEGGAASRETAARTMGETMATTNKAPRLTAAQKRARDERSRRTGKRYAATILAAYRQANDGTPMASEAGEDGRYDALRGIVADAAAKLAECTDGAAMLADVAERLGVTIDALEVWAGDSSAIVRRRTMAELRDREAARVAVAKRVLASDATAAKVERVSAEAEARIIRAASVESAKAEAIREATAERVARIIREGRATAPRPEVDPGDALAASILGAMTPDALTLPA